jgi:hypothetical protein
MSYGLVLVFQDVAEKDYWSVNEKLGINRDSTGDWPKGMMFHTGGPTNGGGFAVIELWKSKADQEAFMGSRLGAALAASGVSAPSQVIETETVNEKFLN